MWLVSDTSKLFTWLHLTFTIKYIVYPFIQKLHIEHLLYAVYWVPSTRMSDTKSWPFWSWSSMKGRNHSKGPCSDHRFIPLCTCLCSFTWQSYVFDPTVCLLRVKDTVVHCFTSQWDKQVPCWTMSTVGTVQKAHPLRGVEAIWDPPQSPPCTNLFFWDKVGK